MGCILFTRKNKSTLLTLFISIHLNTSCRLNEICSKEAVRVVRKKSTVTLHVTNSFYRFHDSTGTWFGRVGGILNRICNEECTVLS